MSGIIGGIVTFGLVILFSPPSWKEIVASVAFGVAVGLYVEMFE